MEEKKEKTLRSRIWKNLAALAIFFGLISITDFTIGTTLGIAIIISAVAVAIFLHTWEKINKVKECFINLKKDIEFIKEKLNEKDDKNE